MKAIIFNSGLGSRMGNLTVNNPKCLVKLYNGETILDRQIRILSECGIKEFIITIGHLKEHIINTTKKYKNLKFVFVENKDYMNTNYIVSMNNASELLNDELFLLHGDLVFNKNLILKMLNSKEKSLCVYNPNKTLPKKDFKGRFKNNILKEVSVNIFDEDCYAFQPLYKLDKETLAVWKNKVKEFVDKGDTKVYAENALNTVTNQINIMGMSYENDYIDEIDNEDDYERVSTEIKFFDYKEQQIEITDCYIDNLKKNLNLKEKIFIVSSKVFENRIKNDLKNYDITVFSDFSPNPKYEEIENGLLQFKNKNYSTIISIGGGSSIDVAKCIKLFSTLNKPNDFINNSFNYSMIKHIAIPTTAGSGSESTQFAVIYYKGEKLSVDHGSILPNLVILDGSLLKTLPDYQKKSTLLDSLCQAIESYWSKGTTIESREYARECIRLILTHYKNYIKNELTSYKDIMIASNYSGKAINISKTTSAHAMSYKITSTYNVSHGHAVAICIVPIWKLLFKKSKSNVQLEMTLLEIAKLFGYDDIEKSIQKFEQILEEFNLSKVNITREDIPMLVESVNPERMKNNPINFSSSEINELYKKI